MVLTQVRRNWMDVLFGFLELTQTGGKFSDKKPALLALRFQPNQDAVHEFKLIRK
jgi:hypothetical protein